eukprot:TRINITY_DN22737_c0_g1_i1.p1 TRINITY_DN22737_c0_g1~~TRINITY_DN22737_c0_g1_i1.p1  ORF type:complete len:170 (-),score=26.28 TRINITY_DN22737_c0_g1_i1:32-541(-)
MRTYLMEQSMTQMIAENPDPLEGAQLSGSDYDLLEAPDYNDTAGLGAQLSFSDYDRGSMDSIRENVDMPFGTSPSNKEGVDSWDLANITSEGIPATESPSQAKGKHNWRAPSAERWRQRMNGATKRVMMDELKDNPMQAQVKNTFVHFDDMLERNMANMRHSFPAVKLH